MIKKLATVSLVASLFPLTETLYKRYLAKMDKIDNTFDIVKKAKGKEEFI